MNENYLGRILTRISDNVFRRIEAYFMPDLQPSVSLMEGHDPAETKASEKVWELNQRYEDIAFMDLKAILAWIFPVRSRRAFGKLYNRAMIYYLTDEIVFLEESETGLRPDHFSFQRNIQPKILKVTAWINTQYNRNTISLMERWSAMVRRWITLARIKNLLENVTFLKRMIPLDNPSVNFSCGFPDFHPELPGVLTENGFKRIFFKIGSAITFPRRN